jgi:tetratricopeptide (TPR) repeat protein
MKIAAFIAVALLILISLGGMLVLLSALVSRVRRAKSCPGRSSKVGRAQAIPFKMLAEYYGGLKKSSNEELRSLFEKGLSLKRRRKFTEAITIFEGCFNGNLTPEQKAGLMVTTGNCYFSLDQFDQAQSCYQTADGFSRESASKNGRLSCLINLGLVFAANGKWDDAIRNYHDAVGWDQKLGFTAGEAIDLNTLALLCERKGDLEAALTHYAASLQIFERLNDPRKAKLVHNNIQRVKSLNAGTRPQL